MTLKRNVMPSPLQLEEQEIEIKRPRSIHKMIDDFLMNNSLDLRCTSMAILQNRQYKLIDRLKILGLFWSGVEDVTKAVTRTDEADAVIEEYLNQDFQFPYAGMFLKYFKITENNTIGAFRKKYDEVYLMYEKNILKTQTRCLIKFLALCIHDSNRENHMYFKNQKKCHNSHTPFQSNQILL